MGWYNGILNQIVSVDGGERSPGVQKALNRFKKFLHSQIIGAIMLLVCALIAVLWANSPAAESYFHLWETELAFSVGSFSFSLTLHEWVNEALMMIFFLMIGLEVKEQILVGELSSPRQALLPVGAALGGMVFPALIFALINQNGVGAAGWGIPMATDIAFALGVLALLGRRVPISLKIFLAALAIADDIGAIMVITLFYTGDLHVSGLLVALGFLAVIFVLARLCIYDPMLYFLLSVGVWAGFLVSGVHATLAGVLVAMLVPAHTLTNHQQRLHRLIHRLDISALNGRNLLRDEEQLQVIEDLAATVHEIEPPLAQLIRVLQPWITFVVLPLFALSNAGTTITGDLGAALFSPITLGVALGLFLGKQIGILSFSWLMVRIGLARLPQGVTWRQVHAVATLAGIGFTVALFVTELAYGRSAVFADEAKIGILVSSTLSGLVGAFLLYRATDPVAVDEAPVNAPAAEPVPLREGRS